MLEKNKDYNTDKDFLDSWREDVGIKKDKDGRRMYYGSCEEEDSLVTAVREYEREQAEKAKNEKSKEEENTL